MVGGQNTSERGGVAQLLHKIIGGEPYFTGYGYSSSIIHKVEVTDGDCPCK